MSDKAGFLVDGKLYPFSATQKLSDAPLVEAVTGLTFEEWAARLEKITEQHPDATAILGLMAISVRNTEPDWPRDKVVQFVGNIDFEHVEFQAGKEEAVSGPPAEPPATAGEASLISSDESTISAEDSQAAPV